MKRLLTIQDVSCVGQCSTTVALPLVSACGIECAVLPSAVLSNHTGFARWSFADLTAEMPVIESEWRAQGLTFDAFYTGYVCASQIDPILSVFEHCAAPGALRIVDPAMADNGRLYAGFGADFPSQMARLCRGADYLLPNLTEAALLTGQTPKLTHLTEREVTELVARLHDLGAAKVVLTGVSFEPHQLGCAISDGAHIVYDFNPRLKRMSHGTGDVFASVFAGAILRGRSACEAAALAADVVCVALDATEPEHTYGVRFERAIPFLVRSLGEA